MTDTYEHIKISKYSDYKALLKRSEEEPYIKALIDFMNCFINITDKDNFHKAWYELLSNTRPSTRFLDEFQQLVLEYWCNSDNEFIEQFIKEIVDTFKTEQDFCNQLGE